ncbi:MAG: hypothetical protein V1837_04255 [Candidatus Woesearchaeota archaeon]
MERAPQQKPSRELLIEKFLQDNQFNLEDVISKDEIFQSANDLASAIYKKRPSYITFKDYNLGITSRFPQTPEFEVMMLYQVHETALKFKQQGYNELSWNQLKSAYLKVHLQSRHDAAGRHARYNSHFPKAPKEFVRGKHPVHSMLLTLDSMAVDILLHYATLRIYKKR